MKYCKRCKATAANHWLFCTKCGYYIGDDLGETETEYECDKCGIKFFGGVFCPSCGSNVTDGENFLFGENAIDHKDLKAGMQVSIGSYPFHYYDEKLPIEWIILAREPGKALLISKYAVEGRRYHEASGCIWEHSEMREWLNTRFADDAFTNEEYGHIATTVQNDGINPPCEDKVFLLSESEFFKYISSSPLGSRIESLGGCRPTEYAQRNGARRGGMGTCQWWLRKNCKNEYDGKCIDRVNKIKPYTQTTIKSGVRPVIWVKLDN